MAQLLSFLSQRRISLCFPAVVVELKDREIERGKMLSRVQCGKMLSSVYFEKYFYYWYSGSYIGAIPTPNCDGIEAR